MKQKETLSYEEEQQYIRDYAKQINAKGIFYLPLLDTYSATILINNIHPLILVDDDKDLKGRTEEYIENGPLWYLIGEVMHVYDGSKAGIYYPYKVKGVHDHSHGFESVLHDCMINYKTFETENEEEYYSQQELRILKALIKYQKEVNAQHSKLGVWNTGEKIKRVPEENKQKIIKNKLNRNKGIFFIAELNSYTSSNSADGEKPYLCSSLTEVLSRMTGDDTLILRYPYTIQGKEDYALDYETILEIAAENFEAFKPIKIDYYYNKLQLKTIDSIIRYQKAANSS